MASGQLDSRQAQALFDILTHHESYAEIQALKHPEIVDHFGIPLQPKTPPDSSSPLLETLLKRFILVLPGLRDVPSDFWTQNIKGLVETLDNGNLSESYDKGSIGIRKTLSTATSSTVEYVSRGTLGGYPKQQAKEDRQYDPSKPDDVIDAWNDFLHGIVYGDLLDKLFAKAAETDQLSEHDSLIRAAHEYAIVILCSFLHYTLIVSPRGQSILPLLARAHGMAPYFLVRQTLKIGNAASMLSGMVKLVLAKMNMSTVTSWFGGQVSDSGMNLLQQIVSTVLGWDTSELKKRASTIEKNTQAPSKHQLEVLKAYCDKSTQEQQKCRTQSEYEPTSIASAILSDSAASPELTSPQQSLALEYVSIQLAIRDREELIRALCHHTPDLFTSSIRSVIPAYDPIIRALHQAVNLSGGVSDLEAFLNDLIKLGTFDMKAGKAEPPTVEDFVKLLHKHQSSSHRFIHQVVKNGPELRQWYHSYAAHAARQYASTSAATSTPASSATAAGDFTANLTSLLTLLSDTDKSAVLTEIDAHAAYISALIASSTTRMKRIINNLATDKSETQLGPGMFLSKWQALMDETRITPANEGGEVRRGGDESVRDATRVDTDGARKGGVANLGGAEGKEEGEGEGLKPPDVNYTVRLLGSGFREMLRGLEMK